MKVPVVKKRRNGRYGNNNWFSYSSKIKRNVNLYSNLEYDHWILIEFNRNVSTFCEQPEHIQEWVNDIWIDTIPDMWCLEDGQELYIEIKPSNELDPQHKDYSPRSASQVEKQKIWCASKGVRYEVRTEEYIYRNKVLLKNLKIMLPHIDNRRMLDEVLSHKIRTFIVSNGRVCLGKIEEEFSGISRSQVRDLIYNLIYHGTIYSSIKEVEISNRLEFWSNEQKTSNH